MRIPGGQPRVAFPGYAHDTRLLGVAAHAGAGS